MNTRRLQDAGQCRAWAQRLGIRLTRPRLSVGCGRDKHFSFLSLTVLICKMGTRSFSFLGGKQWFLFSLRLSKFYIMKMHFNQEKNSRFLKIHERTKSAGDHKLPRQQQGSG